MEASAAGLAASGGAGDAGQQSDGSAGAAEAGQGQQQQNGEQQAGQFDPAQLAQQLETLSTGQEEMRQFLQSNPALQPAAPAEEEPAPPADLKFLEDPQITSEQAAERLQQIVDQRVQEGVSKALTPIQSEVQDLRSQQGADALTSEFPELAKPEVAEAVVKEAERQANVIGQPELVANFQFIKTVYLAGRAAELQQGQEAGADAGKAATLEGAGGASPGGAGQGASQTADQIGESWAKRGSVLPF